MKSNIVATVKLNTGFFTVISPRTTFPNLCEIIKHKIHTKLRYIIYIDNSETNTTIYAKHKGKRCPSKKNTFQEIMI